MDELVGLDAARSFLSTSRDPAIALQVALTLEARDPDDPAVLAARERLYTAPRVGRLFARQNADGSWGDRPDVTRRILPTLWLTKILAELGVRADHPGLGAALDFLESRAVVNGGASITGRRDDVLSCYTGMLADTLLRAGRTGAAIAPLTWIGTYQQVRWAGHDFIGRERQVWGAYLATRYGGCLAGTTCLLGVVKCGLAMTRARRLGVGAADETLIHAIRDLLAEREVFRRRDGSTIPLGAGPGAGPDVAQRWLAPAFPLSYQTDLIEVTTLAAEAGVPRERLQPALSHIAGWQRADGSWPMLRTCSGAAWYQPERPAKDAGSHWITLRVLQLAALLPR